MTSIGEYIQENAGSDSDDELFGLNEELTLDTREKVLTNVKKSLEEEFSHLNPPEAEVRSAQILELV